MIRVLKHRSVLVSLLTLTVQIASAQLYTGLYTLRFDSGNFPLYDLTGSYEMNQEIQAAGGATTPLMFTIPSITHDNSGRLHSTGVLMLTIGDDTVAANYTVSGNVSGGGAGTRAVFTIRLTGQDVISGLQRRFSGSITYKLTVDSNAQLLNGTCQGTLTIAGIGGARLISDSLVSPNLPNGVDGAWQVQMNILSTKKLGGSANVVVNSFWPADSDPNSATGRVMPAKISGSYSAKTEQARVQLTGVNQGRGISLLVTFVPDTSAAHLSGKILGQTIRY